MNDHDLVEAYRARIQEIYDGEGLVNIRDIKRSSLRENPPIDTQFSNITRKAMVKYGTNYFDLYDEILFCSDEVLYFVANLFLYRQFLNDPLVDAERFGGGMVYPNLGNFHSKRYAMFANVAAEKLYNFWDRLGDVLASFFPDIFNKDRVFFVDTVQRLPEQFRKGENYEWLLAFSKNEYVELNKIRKQTVHHFGVATRERQEHLDIFRDREAVQAWQAQRLGYLEFYQRHINLTIEGYQRLLHFLKEIDISLFADIPD